jgi:hypothetical protein
VKVDSDVRRAVVDNPHLKTSELIVGELVYVCNCLHPISYLRKGYAVHARDLESSCNTSFQNQELL